MKQPTVLQGKSVFLRGKVFYTSSTLPENQVEESVELNIPECIWRGEDLLAKLTKDEQNTFLFSSETKEDKRKDFNLFLDNLKFFVYMCSWKDDLGRWVWGCRPHEQKKK